MNYEFHPEAELEYGPTPHCRQAKGDKPRPSSRRRAASRPIAALLTREGERAEYSVRRLVLGRPVISISQNHGAEMREIERRPGTV
jgi:hypothetical protein